MIKHIERLLFLLLPAVAFTACTEDEGTEPGSDSVPGLAIFQQTTTAPNDPDVDGTYRVATNNQTEQLYYLAEPEASAATSDAYAQKVVSEGTQVTLGTDSVTGGRVADVVVKDMKGNYTVSFVAVRGNERTLKQVSFTGVVWNNVANGTYYFASVAYNNFGVPQTLQTQLQQRQDDPTVYRIKNLYGTGYSLTFTKSDVTGTDDDGSYSYITLGTSGYVATPMTYGSYGTLYFADIASIFGDASYRTDPYYGCKLYDNNNVFLAGYYSVLYNGSLSYLTEDPVGEQFTAGN